MFREPEVVEVKTVAKADPTAPARSSIRRQRSVRYLSRNPRDQQPSSGPRSHRHHDRFLEAMRRHETVLSAQARINAERALDLEASANQAHAEASRRRRLESGRATLRDALSYESPRHSMDMARDHSHALSTMRHPLFSTTSSAHSSHRPLHRSIIWENAPGHINPRTRTRRVRTPPPAYIPSPPYTSGPSSPALQSANRAASLTPRFAPAHSLPDINSITGLARIRHGGEDHEDETTDDSMTNELPPLRRVTHRHHPFRSHWEVHSETSRRVVDGLGDRWRSVSPDDDSWETLLSTMPPDERLPSSTSASFRSDEDLAYYESLANISAESVTEAMQTYPVHCENTDTEFSEAEETLPALVEGPARSPPRQIPLLPDREPVEATHESRHDTNRVRVPDRIRNQRHPNRERL